MSSYELKNAQMAASFLEIMEWNEAALAERGAQIVDLKKGYREVTADRQQVSDENVLLKKKLEKSKGRWRTRHKRFMYAALVGITAITIAAVPIFDYLHNRYLTEKAEAQGTISSLEAERNTYQDEVVSLQADNLYSEQQNSRYHAEFETLIQTGAHSQAVTQAQGVILTATNTSLTEKNSDLQDDVLESVVNNGQLRINYAFQQSQAALDLQTVRGFNLLYQVLTAPLD